MTWVKVDDQFQDHPKFLDVSLAGVGLWVAGLAYSSRYLTDGFIAASALRRLNGNKRLVGELTAADLWHEVEGGWRIHDYTDYQPSAARVTETRAARAEAGKRGGQARGRQKQGEATAKQIAKRVADPPLSPRPVPSPLTSDAISLRRLQGVVCFDDDDDRSPDSIAAEAVRLLASRLLERRLAELPDDPVRRRLAWLARAGDELWAEHGAQLVDLAKTGSTAVEIADRLDPAQQAAPVTELAPTCARCGGLRHHPDQPHRVAETDLLPEEAS